MKIFLFLISASLGIHAYGACSDISGRFEGRCEEKFKDSSMNKQPLVKFNITQNACRTVEIVQTSGATIIDSFDLTKGLVEIGAGEDIRVLSGGSFSKTGFTGTILYVANTGSVLTQITNYEKVQKNGMDYLVVNQRLGPSELACEIPAVK